MDSNTYILTSDGELYHYGVAGMKWGVRRTPAQLGHKPSTKKKRVNKAKSIINKLRSKHQAKKIAEEERKKELAKRDKKISEMTDDELRQHLNRVRMEREAYQIDAEISRLNPKKVSAGQKFINDFKERALGPAATEAGRKLLTNLLNKAVDKALGDAKDPLAALKKEAEKAGYHQAIANAKNAAEKAKYQEYLTKEKVDKYNADKAASDRAGASRSSSRAFIYNSGKQKKGARLSRDDYDFDTPLSSVKSETRAAGRQYIESPKISGLLNSPIAGYLPAPKDDD